MPRFARKVTRGIVVTTVVASAVAIGGPVRAAVTVGDEASLRAALIDGAETAITFSADITLADCGTGTLTRASATPITIDGAGHELTQSCGAAVLTGTSSADITITDLTITQQGGTGAIDIDGTLTLTDVNLTGAAAGNGVAVTGDLVLTRSVVSNFAIDGANAGGTISATDLTVSDIGNNAVFATGDITAERVEIARFGLDGLHGAAVTLTDTEITGDASCNAVFATGDVVADRSTLTACTNGLFTSGAVTATNTTVTRMALDGVHTAGDVELDFSTIVGNGNGVVADAVTAHATVVAGSDTRNCVAATKQSQGYNYETEATCGFTDPTDTVNGEAPQLAALADNGGAVATMLPADTSPLIDLIPPAECSVGQDARGVARPSGPTCDIGAVEVDQGPPDPTTSAPPATDADPNVGGPQLPSTGAGSGALTVAAVLCLAVGAVLVRGRRRGLSAP